MCRMGGIVRDRVRGPAGCPGRPRRNWAFAVSTLPASLDLKFAAVCSLMCYSLLCYGDRRADFQNEGAGAVCPA